jgi:hypothetical protein
VVYSGGPSVKVAGEILHCDHVRDTRSVSRMIQSGSHKIITGTGINPPYANQNDLYSPTNIIAIGSDRVTIENALKRRSKIYTLRRMSSYLFLGNSTGYLIRDRTQQGK